MKSSDGANDNVGAVSSSRLLPSIPPSAAKVFATVREVPRGSVTSYGAIARLHGLSPRYVGGAMAHAPEDVAWWRVVGAGGAILTNKRLDGTGQEQTARLRAEGVPFDELGRVQMDRAEFEL